MHTPPTLSYSGLTIIMANPSRFDIDNGTLLCGTGGWFLKTKCLEAQGIDIRSCDVRTVDDTQKLPLLPNTLCLLLLGQRCLEVLGVASEQAYTINTIRGYLIATKAYPHITTILSYLPQEAIDIFDHESELNSLLNQTNGDDEPHNEDTEEDYVATEIGESALLQKSKHGKTSRKNWSFWLQQDVNKIVALLYNGGKTLRQGAEPRFELYPEAASVINTLTQTKNQHIYVDIETDESLNIRCFGFHFGNSNVVYIVPFFTYDYQPAYSLRCLALIHRAIVIALRDNIVVAHNGAAFDFVVLGMRYRIPVGARLYDTMLAQHRIWPEAEKSLGHCISMWLYEPYHKDDGYYNPCNPKQEKALWTYCAKDVWTTRLVHEQQTLFASKDKGLQDSIQQVNASIRPYLITSLMGMSYDDAEVEAIIKENDSLMTHYNLFIERLIGAVSMKVVKGGSSKNMPGSNPQCVRYFHEMLLYKVTGRSKKSNKPSLGAKNMFKLKLLYNNPVIDLVLAYRKTQKETGALQFTPWEEIWK